MMYLLCFFLSLSGQFLNNSVFARDIPTRDPTRLTTSPSTVPSLYPTGFPSIPPSIYPSGFPTLPPTTYPSGFPSLYPSRFPTIPSSAYPSGFPSLAPTAYPGGFPTISPTGHPISPTLNPIFHSTLVSRTTSLFPTNATFTTQSQISNLTKIVTTRVSVNHGWWILFPSLSASTNVVLASLIMGGGGLAFGVATTVVAICVYKRMLNMRHRRNVQTVVVNVALEQVGNSHLIDEYALERMPLSYSDEGGVQGYGLTNGGLISDAVDDFLQYETSEDRANEEMYEVFKTPNGYPIMLDSLSTEEVVHILNNDCDDP